MTLSQYRQRSPYSFGHYLQMLRKLLPRGKPWGFFVREVSDVLYDHIEDGSYTVINDSVDSENILYDTILSSFEIASTLLGKYYSVFAEEFSKFATRVYDLVNESVPGLSNELLPEWVELMVANNDELQLIQGSEDDQRAFAHGKRYNEGRIVNAQFFVDYGVTLGFVLTVDEYPLSGSILSCSTSASDADCAISGVCGSAVDPTAQPYVYGCGRAGAFNVIEITIVSGTGNLELMQNLFARAKPAHAVIVWVDAR